MTAMIAPRLEPVRMLITAKVAGPRIPANFSTVPKNPKNSATPASPAGPVLVTVEYRARPGSENELMTILEDTRFSRRRTGATYWRAWRDASDPSRILEAFVVASWDEHLRQHERVTQRDQARLDRVRALTDPDHPVTITHWLTPS